MDARRLPAAAPISDLILHWQSPGLRQQEFKLDRGRFVVINALTLSGFQTVQRIDGYTLFGRIYIFFLTIVGTFFV